MYTPDEMMTVTAARSMRNGMTCFVGIGLPSEAANLARRTHAPDLVLIYESGAVGAKPDHVPLSIGDGVLAETADAVVSVPEIFNYWLQPGRIDVGFLGAAQLDRYGNINTTMIGGNYARPAVRLPGSGGAPEIAAACRLDSEHILKRAQDDDIKARLKTNTDEVISRGGFGSPTMFVNERDMYFGNDRIPLVEAALSRH